MTRRVDVRRKADGALLVRGARWCSSFLCRLRGLMFRRQLAPGEALILVEAAESRAAASIHMLFVPFPIAAIWINSAGRVVDMVEAKPWRPFYAPRAPARYTLESEPEILSRVSIGDEVVFEDSPAGVSR
ncbi:MAG: DUF192 domain-containing protein [Anaerolineales bacterium]|nr:DUF192 domain-containing protein [Anaerolineales bacterium]